jgi:hypothetical protein
MLSILVFLVLIGAFIACVYYAISHEDTAAGQIRLGPLARALGRVRKRRSSPQAAPARPGEESTGFRQCGEPSSAPQTEKAPHSPAP